MNYEGQIYIPGRAESQSLILQVTLGCSHNKCTFCSFFKDKPFRVKSYEQIEQDILEARKLYPYVPSVFLADGDVVCLSMDRLRPILLKIREVFPEADHVNMYGNFRDVYRKSVEELKELKELGVKMIYTSLESGSDKVLSDIKKGVTSEQIIEASRKLDEAGILYSSNIILGLGGVADSDEHVEESIHLINEMNSYGTGCMILNPQSGTPLYEDIQSGKFELPTYRQILEEERRVLTGIKPEKQIYVYSGGFLPGLQVFVGNLPEDHDIMMQVLKNRENINSHILDQKLRMNG
ncbi:MAG: radical SAM protein, partial [bacterium]|nr:radical SAM protein [bacterium]